MRRRFVPRQLLAVVMSGLLAGGCGSISGQFGYQGVGIPATKDIAEYYANAGNEAAYGAKSEKRLNVEQYLLTSLTYTNVRCQKFFEELEGFRQDRDFIDQVVTAAIAAGSPWLAITNSAKTVARVTSALSIGNQINKYTADVYAFYAFRKSLKRHVFDGLSAFQAQKGLDLLSKKRYGFDLGLEDVGPPGNLKKVKLNDGKGPEIKFTIDKVNRFLHSHETEDLLIAQTLSTDYAAICSLENMRRIVEDSLNTSKTSVEANSNPAAPTTTKTTSNDQEAKDQALAAKDSAQAAAASATKQANRAETARTEAEVAKSGATVAQELAERAADKAEGANGVPDK